MIESKKTCRRKLENTLGQTKMKIQHKKTQEIQQKVVLRRICNKCLLKKILIKQPNFIPQGTKERTN